MKVNIIRISGKQVFENSDELEEGYVEIVGTLDDLLGDINAEVLSDYACYMFDLKHEDDFESSLDDFDRYDLVEHLKDSWFNFAEEVEEGEMIEILENRGYIISDDRTVSNDYDYVDNCLFDDIVKKFDSLSVFDRQKLRDIIINFK